MGSIQMEMGCMRVMIYTPPHSQLKLQYIAKKVLQNHSICHSPTLPPHRRQLSAFFGNRGRGEGAIKHKKIFQKILKLSFVGKIQMYVLRKLQKVSVRFVTKYKSVSSVLPVTSFTSKNIKKHLSIILHIIKKLQTEISNLYSLVNLDF